MDYDRFFADRLSALRGEGAYRVFADLERQVGAFPKARNYRDGKVSDVTIWCNNDYLGMGMSDHVIGAMCEATKATGAGAGGTRNISGTNHYHVLLEQELADWHNKDSALLFTSGYVANMTTLMTLGGRIPDLVIFSDEKNHNSMIEGVRHSRAPKEIFKHNDVEDLDRRMAKYPKEHPKLVAFESVYSMDGDIAPLREIVDCAKAHNALTFLDEVHAVGMYGERGSGVAERDGVADEIDIIQATMGKAIGVIGGYIAGKADLIDFVRSFGNGFIFTTSLPPSVASGALASVRYLKDHNDLRLRHQERAATLKRRFTEANIPIIPSVSHIVPVLVGDAKLCKQASDMLLNDHGIYVQPINYPTVARGTERLRVTPTPLHTDADMDHLVDSFMEVWGRLGIQMAA
ncbi:5-aminolevulinate synthase [Roseospirillum parvum]|uniref:5-aminolevulinate synthase n=1 Tax=Roseospirillum parvum TaxID=83401 RepID=A0A1G7V9L7_9PROT|nr:5-aminolevulinate synthase [Roseospirillum parvum]SDG56029.1 5-aminolevulinate synthase [Roseospirillum parvum]